MGERLCGRMGGYVSARVRVAVVVAACICLPVDESRIAQPSVLPGAEDVVHMTMKVSKPYGEVVLGFSCLDAAERCVAHVEGCEWGQPVWAQMTNLPEALGAFGESAPKSFIGYFQGGRTRPA